MLVKSKDRFTHSFYRLFACTTFLMFLANLIFVSIVIKDYQKNLQVEASAYLKSIGERVEDDLHKGLEDIVFTLFKSKDINKYIYSSSSMSPKNILILDLMDELNRILEAPNNIFSDCAIYYPDADELVSGKYGYFQMHREANNSYRNNYNIDVINTYNCGVSIIVPSQNQSYITTVVYKYNNGVAVIFVLKDDYFDSLFYNDFAAASEPGGIIVEKLQGELVYQNGIEMEEWTRNEKYINLISSIGDQDGFFRVKNNQGKSFLCTISVIDNLELRLIKLKNETITDNLKNYSSFLIIFIIGTFGAVLAGYYITYRLSNKMFTPLSKLLNIIHADNFFDVANKNELELIGEYFESSQLEMKKLKRILSSNKILIKDKFIKYLIENDNPELEHILEYSSMLDIQFNGDFFVVAEINLSEVALNKTGYTECNLMKMRIIYEIEECYSSEDSQILSCEYSAGKIIAIIIGHNYWKEELQSFVGFLDNLLKDSIPFFISIGTVQEQYSGIPASAKSAKLLSNSFFFTPEEITYHFADEVVQASSQHFEDFINAVSNNSFSGGVNTINEARKLFSQYPLDSENCNRALIVMTQYFVGAFKENKVSLSKDDAQLVLYPQLYFNNVYEYLLNIEEKLKVINDKAENQNSILNIINAYVKEHLGDDLSLTVLSAQVDMSPKYLSKVYKDQTGQTISSYILENRIEKAAEELRNTRKTVEIIALETGFSSSAYFIKCFKSKMGTTPKNYREKV